MEVQFIVSGVKRSTIVEKNGGTLQNPNTVEWSEEDEVILFNASFHSNLLYYKKTIF